MSKLTARYTGLGAALSLVAAALAWVLLGSATAGDPPGAHDRDYTRTKQSYQVPDVTLRDRHGEPVQLTELIDRDRPVLVQFIFTSCETVCPMLTATMSEAQGELRALRADTRIVSISIDPEYDTPERLRRYAERHGAEGDWTFLTGSRQAVRRTLNAFNAMYQGRNKMNHKPYTFIRRAGTDTWLRLIGTVGASTLVAEYRALVRAGTGGDA